MEKKEDDIYIKAFATVLKEVRKDRKMSQEELADRAGLHVTFISRLENCVYQPSLTTLFQIAKALEMDIADFVNRMKKLIG